MHPETPIAVPTRSKNEHRFGIGFSTSCVADLFEISKGLSNRHSNVAMLSVKDRLADEAVWKEVAEVEVDLRARAKTLAGA